MPLSISVVVASLGRPDILSDLLQDLRAQSRPPDRIVLSVTDPADLPAEVERDAVIELVFGPKGSCVQRNSALDRFVRASDIILFCDDDYVPSRFAIERVLAFFAANPDVAGACGDLLADGINGPGIAVEEARAILAGYDAGVAPPPTAHRDLGGLYGCNMAFRATAITDVRFDERLRLYGWQEDIDFAARVRGRGRIVKSFAFAGVHRGVKQARSPGVRFGYSQVINPVYLVRKGTMGSRYAARIVARNVFANHLRAFRPEPWVDRLGRVRGNWVALLDLLRGRVTPERVEQL